jgi:hypothetical protein
VYKGASFLRLDNDARREKRYMHSTPVAATPV